MRREVMPRVGGPKAAYIASAFFSAAGLPLSAYLISPPGIPQFCEIGNIFSCEAVIQSEYSRIFGIPVAALGAGWFGVALFLSVLAIKKERGGYYLLGWSALGVIGALALLYLEVFQIGSICLLCTMAHALGAAVFASAFLARIWSQPPITSG